MKATIVIRGLPGSGKTTLAKRLIRHYGLCPGIPKVLLLENDIVRELLHGEYQYSPSDYDQVRSHSTMLIRFLSTNKLPFIVSNVFSTIHSISKTLDELPKYVVVKCVGNFDSTHDVPSEDMDRLTTEWEDVPGEITYDGNFWNLVAKLNATSK